MPPKRNVKWLPCVRLHPRASHQQPEAAEGEVGWPLITRGRDLGASLREGGTPMRATDTRNT